MLTKYRDWREDYCNADFASKNEKFFFYGESCSQIQSIINGQLFIKKDIENCSSQERDIILNEACLNSYLDCMERVNFIDLYDYGGTVTIVFEAMYDAD